MMAAVIADDLTGAAELASAAAESGFSAEVHTKFDPATKAEIVCLDTDTRLAPPDQAARIVERAAREILRSNPSWIFKKTDSVLRGNVRAEIEAILGATGLRRAILSPANPTKGRAIRDGIYLIDGVPLDRTSFAHDQHHPRTSSRVSELLGQQSPTERIEIPNTATVADVHSHAARLHPSDLPAGGVDFFQAVLKARAGARPAARVNPALTPPILICCGSLQAWHNGRRELCQTHGLPLVFAETNVPADQCARLITREVARRGAAMIALGDQSVTPPQVLTRFLADAVAHFLHQQPITTLCIEGGATAAAILGALGFDALAAHPSAFPGVAILRPSAPSSLILLLKPGSYPWPDAFCQNLP